MIKNNNLRRISHPCIKTCFPIFIFSSCSEQKALLGFSLFTIRIKKRMETDYIFTSMWVKMCVFDDIKFHLPSEWLFYGRLISITRLFTFVWRQIYCEDVKKSYTRPIGERNHICTHVLTHLIRNVWEDYANMPNEVASSRRIYKFSLPVILCVAFWGRKERNASKRSLCDCRLGDWIIIGVALSGSFGMKFKFLQILQIDKVENNFFSAFKFFQRAILSENFFLPSERIFTHCNHIGTFLARSN